MGFYISSLFYPRELRRLIKGLDSEGHLNKRPLWELEKDFLRKFLILACMPAIVFIYAPEQKEMGILFFFTSVLTPILVIRDTVKYYIFPCTRHNITQAMILTDPKFGPWRLDIFRRYLSFEYNFLDKNFDQHPSFKLEGFWKKFCGQERFSKGKKVHFVLNEEKVSKSFPLTKVVMEIWSLDVRNLEKG